ncbi:outer membrane beta-barrel family protein [Runella sp. MFBS21]|uniref:outer membrane beta-barrel family protein n=1 Tax=Runella sp. MFBS21 TaxID=3034018 RepID=UPI0023F752CD|nr:outer membrane beta-barrel family protein [Runella sp. MFBS21]MCA0233114.1 TonB-dependent receptor family protein [Bacteroidota bacterium]MDF7821238.1 outer membrane beta-barrel family protein [Runella sp. MFBS21]
MKSVRKYLLIGFIPLISTVSTFAQKVAVSGKVLDVSNKNPLPYVNVILKKEADSSFVTGAVSNEEGIFVLNNIVKGNYLLSTSLVGYLPVSKKVSVGQLSEFLDLGKIELTENKQLLEEVKVIGQQVGVSSKMDKQTYLTSDNLAQSGGSVLQMMNNLPGVTTTQEGTLQIRGSDKVVVLIDSKQTALTGFGSQKGLENIPASAIEKIEIINNPSAKYDANGNAGIINLIFKKNEQFGWNGKVGLTAGLGALWQKQTNLPNVQPQFQATPKYNPSFSVNHRSQKANVFLQGDWLYTQTLNKNEFSTRTYTTGERIVQQLVRNRTTTYATVKAGLDYTFDKNNTLTVSGLFNREKILDNGDNPYFLGNDYANRYRLWQFLEDEVKYTAIATAVLVHKFKQAGHLLNLNYNYTFHREDEKYFFTNTLPTSKGTDSFKLLSDEQVSDLNLDYVKPLAHGKLETGIKLRRRTIPVNMQFFPGANSVIDVNAGGWANYYETIPALYGNYIYENPKLEVEAGLRLEYVRVNYEINPNHNTYKSDGYNYTQPFPNVRLAYKINENNKLSVFFNRRVDRPNEVDIRIFPKYDEPELIKVGNPTLKPQFTTSVELGYRHLWNSGSLYGTVYHRLTDGTISRIATQAPNNVVLFNIFQNIGRSYNTGVELVWQQDFSKFVNLNASVNIYQNTIEAFSITNKYPIPTTYTGQKQQLTSGNFKVNALLHLPQSFDWQVTSIYLAPDLIPQGRIGQRYSLDMGLKKTLKKGELFLNATDLLNTMNIHKTINGTGFTLNSTDYYETQVVRAGYSRKF